MLSVKQYQRNLKYYKGYYTGSIDGVVGPKTKAAVKAFQKDNGLVVDGVYGSKTNVKLIAEVKKYQKKLGVKQDGIIGTATIAAINAERNKNLEPGQLSKHFRKSEFKCKCGGKYCGGYPAAIDSNLIRILEGLRTHYDRPVTITSGLRCKKHNKVVGGATNSAHKKGKAADIYIAGVSRENIKKKAYQLGAAYCYYGTPGMGQAVHINV